MVFLWFSYGYPRLNVYSSMWKTLLVSRAENDRKLLRRSVLSNVLVEKGGYIFENKDLTMINGGLMGKP